MSLSARDGGDATCSFSPSTGGDTATATVAVATAPSDWLAVG